MSSEPNLNLYGATLPEPPLWRDLVHSMAAAYIDQEGDTGTTRRLDEHAAHLVQTVERQQAEAAKRVLKGLHPLEREVLIRFYVQEQSPDQICREMTLTEDRFRQIKDCAKDEFHNQYRQLTKSAPAEPVRRPEGGESALKTGVRVLEHARETFGSAEKANHWLRRPNHVFQGKTPMEAIESDPEAVEIELTRIDHGVYI